MADANSQGAGVFLPLVGATVALLGTTVSALTDAEGYFSLTLADPEAAERVLDIDGAGANPAPGGAAYAGFREAITLVPHVDNRVERPFYMPRLAAESLTQVNPVTATVVENPTLGITLAVPLGPARSRPLSVWCW